jgi:uncharacterized membrane protein
MRNKNREKGLALLSFALALLILVPLIGLAVDTAMLYITKERLNAAVQLSLKSAQRSQEPGEAVHRYFTANFPEGFLGVKHRQIQYTQGKLHASVEAPTYFMKIIRIGSVNVEASASLPAPAEAVKHNEVAEAQ